MRHLLHSSLVNIIKTCLRDASVPEVSIVLEARGLRASDRSRPGDVVALDFFAEIEHIHTINEPLKQAIQLHNNGRIQVEVIPIVISRTRNFHTRTLAEIAQLVSLKQNQPDALTYKHIPHQAQTIAMTLHKHPQEWLTLMSKISRNILTQRHAQKKTPTIRHDN